MEKSWNSALTACELMNGHLFEPANLQQNDNAADHALSSVGEKWLWFGITDAETEGQWETASTKTTIPFEIREKPMVLAKNCPTGVHAWKKRLSGRNSPIQS